MKSPRSDIDKGEKSTKDWALGQSYTELKGKEEPVKKTKKQLSMSYK